MKRFLAIFLMMALVAWAAPVSAIKVEGEKIEKKDDPQPAEKPADKAASESSSQNTESATKADNPELKKLRSVVESKKDQKATENVPRYDPFPDVDNNGVNDKLIKPKSDEGNKPNAAVKMAQPKTTTKAAPKTKPASTSTSTKKKSETTSTKKKPD